MDENKIQTTVGLPTWKSWIALKESVSCQCSCKECKSGDCSNCSCKECKCDNCNC